MTPSPYFLAIQSTYEWVEVALYAGSKLLNSNEIDKKSATESLIPCIQSLLDTSHLQYNQISFITATTGPAPFTTLRVVIATINGMAFATQTPLIGIDAFTALFEDHHISACTTIALLKAFSNQVYYAIKNKEETLVGCATLNDLFVLLNAYKNQDLCFIGNGVRLYHDTLLKEFPDAHLRTDSSFCSLSAIAKLALSQWQREKRGQQELFPLYLKKA